MDKTKRVVLYDWLRLIATVFVILGHSLYTRINTPCGGIYYELPAALHPVYTSIPFRIVGYLSGWVYHFHMPLFFVLSGAVLALGREKSLHIFLRDKAKRLLIPYYVCGLLFMLPIKALTGFYSAETLRQAIPGFLLASGDSGHLWFLPALFWCMLLFALLHRGLRLLLPQDSLLSAGILTAVCGLLTLVGRQLPANGNAPAYLFWFALGFACEKLRQRFPVCGIAVPAAALAVLTVGEAADCIFGLYPPFLNTLSGVLLSCALAGCCTRLFPAVTDTKAWDLIIRNLFAVYLFHDPLEYIVLRLFIPGGAMSTAAGCIGYLLCRTVGVFFVSVLLGESVRTALRRITGRQTVSF